MLLYDFELSQTETMCAPAEPNGMLRSSPSMIWIFLRANVMINPEIKLQIIVIGIYLMALTVGERQE